MALSIHNSLSGKREVFEPVRTDRVRIYTCGPTVYNFNHIGNFRSYIFADTLRRWLKLSGYGVEHTMNITDVEDKIIASAAKAGEPIDVFTGRYIEAFLADIRTLRIEEVEHRPRATHSIPTMLTMIGDLEKRGHTYSTGGSVYFRLGTFAEYGRLSRIDPESLRTAADGRFQADEYTKENVRDFALWKGQENDEPCWPSPWGCGRPGWHIECSAMIREIYGEGGVDIHTGGIDLLFPHHENEIAQSRAAFPGENFVKYWMHNEHLLVDGKKMSKSLGNFYMLREILESAGADQMTKEGRAPSFVADLAREGRSARAMRYLLMSTHYRHKLNFTFDNLKASDAACDRIQTAVDRLREAVGDKGEARAAKKAGVLSSLPSRFKSSRAKEAAQGIQDAMDDDLNTPRALASLFDFIRDVNTAFDKGISKEEAAEYLAVFQTADQLLDIVDFVSSAKAPVDSDFAARVESLLAGRNAARKSKNFKEADRIRDELNALGVQIIDTPAGSRWEKTR